MMDEMILNRTYASTAVEGRKLRDALDSVDEAFEHFYKVVDENDIKNLLKTSVRLKSTPLLLHYAISKYSSHKKEMATLLFKEILKHPLLLRKRLLYSVIKRVYL